MAERATMRDVAALAGVSLKTVSRVVNNEGSVSPDLEARVTRAAEQLRYRHNIAASNLRSGQRSRAVALLVQDLSNEYSAILLRAVSDVARDRGIVVLSASLDEEEGRERELVANFIGRRIDGMIMMPATTDQSYLQPDVAAGFAVVMIDREPRGLSADSVVVDNVEGAERATAHLIRHGHRRIALVSDDPRVVTAQDRRQGYERALSASGIALERQLVRSARTVGGSMDQVRELLSLDDPPTAIFAARNTSTAGAAISLKRMGKSHLVALVGFDELQLAELADPGITTLAQDPAHVGSVAVGLLLDRLDGQSEPPRVLTLPTALTARGSGEIRPPD
ncbi:LacI family DNA-binding transcriptional regulator [soil metagenome]|jgi:LacI family transcriptional regulator